VILNPNQRDAIEYYPATIKNAVQYYEKRIEKLLDSTKQENEFLEKSPQMIITELEGSIRSCIELGAILKKKDLSDVLNSINLTHLPILKKSLTIYKDGIEKSKQEAAAYLLQGRDIEKELENLNKAISAFY